MLKPYHLAPEGSHKRWNSGVITDEMRSMIEAVAVAVDSGMFYNVDVFAAVAPQFGFTEEERAAGVGRVEGGEVGMEIYYARQQLKAERALAAQGAAAERLALHVGKNLGALHLHTGGGKIGNWRNATVEEIDGFTVKLKVTAGGRRYLLTTSPAAIERALAQGG